jgi:hypothetical protein
LLTASNSLKLFTLPAILYAFDNAIRSGSTHITDFRVNSDYLFQLRLLRHIGQNPSKYQIPGGRAFDVPDDFTFINSQMTAFCVVVEELTKGRRVAVTGTGRLGLVPDCAEVGDEVAVVGGVTAPMILRGDGGQEDGRYELIGDAHVLGLMNGEALDTDNLALKDLVLV